MKMLLVRQHGTQMRLGRGAGHGHDYGGCAASYSAYNKESLPAGVGMSGEKLLKTRERENRKPRQKRKEALGPSQERGINKTECNEGNGGGKDAAITRNQQVVEYIGRETGLPSLPSQDADVQDFPAKTIERSLMRWPRRWVSGSW